MLMKDESSVNRLFPSDAITIARSRCQLKILDEIHAICTSLNTRFWLRGGWAIDFLLGRITRPHDDIDLVAWVRHREKIERSLIDAGFQCIPVSTS
ncbi:hypothetical protein [Paenibacillus sp. RC67]|uniref:nucleotidyltransferase domain-containing protein n=1 Tax=Paenibacillus sp. RC67 TaxID=3039392 RepID=UPI0024AE24B3|nr:hypothetical protein [Paenibacillus sp. RC67]